MARKRHKALLPKRIAGVKVPKSVRKGPLGQLLASRTGQALLAEAIMAAGAVGVAKQAKDKADQTQQMTGGVVADALRRWQGAGGHGHGNETDAAGATVAYALGEAARVFVRTLGEHKRQLEPGPEVQAEWRAKDDSADGSKKKPAPSEAGSV